MLSPIPHHTAWTMDVIFTLRFGLSLPQPSTPQILQFNDSVIPSRRLWPFGVFGCMAKREMFGFQELKEQSSKYKLKSHKLSLKFDNSIKH